MNYFEQVKIYTYSGVFIAQLISSLKIFDTFFLLMCFPRHQFDAFAS